MSKESVIDEQTQTKKNDDELINENNDIEDNNDHNYDNTLQETVIKIWMNVKLEMKLKILKSFLFQIIFMIPVDRIDIPTSSSLRTSFFTTSFIWGFNLLWGWELFWHFPLSVFCVCKLKD